MYRRMIVTAAALAGLLVVLQATAASASPIVSSTPLATELVCPVGDAPVAVASNLVLTHDLTCTGKHVEWDIAPGVTVELGFHTLTVASTDRCTVDRPPCNFEVGAGTIRNGTLIGADVHISDGQAKQVVVRNALAEVTGSGELTSSLVLEGHVAIERSGRLTRSWVVNGDGVQLFDLNASLTNFQVSDNLIIGNTGTGIRLSTHFFRADDVTGAIQRNIVAHNTGDGISLTGDLRDLGAIKISQNLVTGNRGTGIVVSGARETPLPDITGGPVTIARNVVFFNRGAGINASWIAGLPTGIVDGGHNFVRFNGVRPECVGVKG
jgi:hypothetical protein